MGLLFIFLTLTFTVLGQLLLKRGMLEIGSVPGQLALWPAFIWRALTSLRVISGLACAVIAAVAWMMAVSRVDLSFAYPFMAIAIVLVLALSGTMFGETVPLTRWVGVGIVCIGIVVTAWR